MTLSPSSENTSPKTDYRKTLNLPQTDFPMKADLAQREPTFLKKWEEENLFAQIKEKWARSKECFILHDGPPYANGHIHIGHALNKILKDMIVKYKTLKGYNSYYLPGWDCHGLPIEHQLLKELKKDKSQIEHVSFRRQAHDYAMKFVGIQREEFKRLGVFGDWANPYLTLDPEYEYWILKSLAELTKKGFVYRGLKPVNWCFQCETALAEAEVEYEDHTSPSVYVEFKVNNPEKIAGLPKDKPVYLMIWTTTPWTLIANVAVAVHLKFQYAFVDLGNEIVILESSLAPKVLAKKGIENFKIVKEVEGAALKTFLYTHPFDLKKDCRVILVDYVTKGDGTGLVHTAPGHGQEDFIAGQVNGLEVVMPVNDRGIFSEYAGEFKGQHVFKANDQIIERLKEKGTLFHPEKIQHTYPHCWRCKNPVIFRATEQWFLKVDHDNLRQKLMEAIRSKVAWVPSSGQERILGMVKGRPDWCLSRQRFWGVPIPALVCQCSPNEYILSEKVIEHLAQVVRQEGSDVWFKKPVHELIPEGFVCKKCGKKDFQKTNDILDVWFDSGVSHQAVLKGMMQRDIPAELYLEGSDQHRGWFQSSLIPAVAIEGKPPFKAVLTHGFVVDGQGRKMSKSLGNVIAPQDVIKNFGVDILRLWVASSNYSEDIRLSKEILDRIIDAYRKIRNTIRFILSNLYDFDPDQHAVAFAQLPVLDRWALGRLGKTLKAVNQAYESYEFDKVYRTIYAFCNDDLSSIYLDIQKDRLYTSTAHSLERRAVQSVLYTILDVLLRVLSPVLSFTTQEAFTYLPKHSRVKDIANVHLLSWPQGSDSWNSSQEEQELKVALDLRLEILKALEIKRQEGLIGSSLEARLVISTASENCFQELNRHKDILRYFYIVSQVEFKKAGSVTQGISPDFPTTSVAIEKADGQKCSRCWNYSVQVGKDKNHPTLCERCVPVVNEV